MIMFDFFYRKNQTPLKSRDFKGIFYSSSPCHYLNRYAIFAVTGHPKPENLSHYHHTAQLLFYNQADLAAQIIP